MVEIFSKLQNYNQPKKIKPIQMLIINRMVIQMWYIYTTECSISQHKQSTPVCVWISKHNSELKKLGTCILYDSTYFEFKNRQT